MRIDGFWVWRTCFDGIDGTRCSVALLEPLSVPKNAANAKGGRRKASIQRQTLFGAGGVRQQGKMSLRGTLPPFDFHTSAAFMFYCVHGMPFKTCHAVDVLPRAVSVVGHKYQVQTKSALRSCLWSVRLIFLMDYHQISTACISPYSRTLLEDGEKKEGRWRRAYRGSQWQEKGSRN